MSRPFQSPLASHPDAIDCTLFRQESQDPDADELELGDAHLLLLGAFEAPKDWDAREREDYFDGEDPQQFFSAQIERSEGATFEVQVGDYLAAQPSPTEVVMYYIYDQQEDENGTYFVLIHDEIEL